MRECPATKKWLSGLLKLAMPHVFFLDPSTKHENVFDANIEFMGGEELPPGWCHDDWEQYVGFLEKYYGTSDKRVILLRMYTEDTMPIWDRGQRRVRIVPKDNVKL